MRYAKIRRGYVAVAGIRSLQFSDECEHDKKLGNWATVVYDDQQTILLGFFVAEEQDELALSLGLIAEKKEDDS